MVMKSLSVLVLHAVAERRTGTVQIQGSSDAGLFGHPCYKGDSVWAQRKIDFDDFTVDIDAHGVVADNLGAHIDYLNIFWDDDKRDVKGPVQVTYNDLTDGSCNMAKLREFWEKENHCCDDRKHPLPAHKGKCFDDLAATCKAWQVLPGPDNESPPHACCINTVGPGGTSGFPGAVNNAAQRTAAVAAQKACFDAAAKCPPVTKTEEPKKRKGCCRRQQGGHCGGRVCMKDPVSVCDNINGCSGFKSADTESPPQRWPRYSAFDEFQYPSPR